MIRKVEFDTHGTTNDCPMEINMTSDRCLTCLWYRGHKGFTVYCGFTEDMQPDIISGEDE